MVRFANRATPPTAGTARVPPSVAPEGLSPSATVTVSVRVVTQFPNASSNATVTAGAIDHATSLALGHDTKPRCVGAAATTSKAALVARGRAPNDAPKV